MITAQTELFSSIRHEMEPLFVGHHHEIGNFIDKMPLDPKYDEYLKLEQLNKLQICTVRDDGKLIGYYVGIIDGGLHYRSTLTNKMDIFYVDKSSRGGGSVVGKLMFTFVLRENMRRGVKFWRVGAKINTAGIAFINSLELEFNGKKFRFEPIETHSAMWLGD
jgi:hypothetical protein